MLSEKQKKQLRRLGHALKPVVLIGDKGLTEAVIAECDKTLEHHELIKVKARGRDRNARSTLFASLCDATGAECVQLVGAIALIYRAHREQPKLTFE